MTAPRDKPQVDKGDIFAPYVYAGATYDDNVFLVSGPAEARQVTGDTQMSDFLMREGLGLRMKLPISLQTLRFDGALERIDYATFNNLDHYEGHAKFALDWEVGRILDGTLSHSYRRDASSFSEFQQQVTDIRNVRATHASGSFKFLTAWRFELGGTRRDVDYERQNFLDRQQHSVYTALHYATSVNTQVGLRARHTQADLAPLAGANGPLNLDYHQFQYRLLLGWEGTRTSYFKASVGYTRREREAGPSSFDAFTGRLTYRWDINRTTQLKASVYRNLNALDYQIASFVVSNGVSVKSTWQATQAMRLMSRVSYEHNKFKGPLVDANGDVVAAAGREDDVLSAGLGVEYALTDNLQLSMGVESRLRDSNRQGSDYNNVRVSTGLTYAF